MNESRQRRGIRSALIGRGYPKEGIDLNYLASMPQGHGGGWNVIATDEHGKGVLTLSAPTADGVRELALRAPKYRLGMAHQEFVVQPYAQRGAQHGTQRVPQRGRAAISQSNKPTPNVIKRQQPKVAPKVSPKTNPKTTSRTASRVTPKAMPKAMPDTFKGFPVKGAKGVTTSSSSSSSRGKTGVGTLAGGRGSTQGILAKTNTNKNVAPRKPKANVARHATTAPKAAQTNAPRTNVKSAPKSSANNRLNTQKSIASSTQRSSSARSSRPLAGAGGRKA